MKHSVRWFAVDPTTRELIPRNRHMPAGSWGWEVRCSCGQQTRTGGEIHARMQERVWAHTHFGIDLGGAS